MRRTALYASDMMIAKYFGLKKGGAVALTLSNRSLNQAAGFPNLGNVLVCLHNKETRISAPENTKSSDETRGVLRQPSADIIECPGALSEVRAEWMSEIVVSNDVP